MNTHFVKNYLISLLEAKDYRDYDMKLTGKMSRFQAIFTNSEKQIPDEGSDYEFLDYHFDFKR